MTPLPPEFVNTLLVIERFVVVASWPDTETPVARPSGLCFPVRVLFDITKELVPELPAVAAPIKTALALMFVKDEFWMVAVNADEPFGASSIAWFQTGFTPVDGMENELAPPTLTT